MMTKTINNRDRINNLMNRDDLKADEMLFLRDCKHNLNYLGHIKMLEEIELNTLYFKYFIDYVKATKENKHLGDF